MDCDHGDQHSGLSPNGKPGFHENETQVISTQSQTSTEPSGKKDKESRKTSATERDLSPEDVGIGGISRVGKLVPLAFDVNVKEVQMEPQGEVKHDLSEAFPVCVQLPGKSHIGTYKTTQSHRKISHSSTSTIRSALSMKAPAEDLCASVLLACLFCRVWDCVLVLADGCQFCMTSLCSCLCSGMCCCEPSPWSCLEDVLLVCSGCSCHECVEACGCSWGAESALDCSFCDLCLQTSECLELGMELSQLLFH
ncbi:hypothetical protein DNTS_015929 [Danionella cerebrum]|uniref:MyoD family inhibitor domain-containing protein n=1 Tax=Danionella cerebrum TaxID=2873325 RepID=A0A553NM94_9TELE|nr:hypothetical protein DNTS_015929 [Danionella translucida]